MPHSLKEHLPEDDHNTAETRSSLRWT